MHAPASGAAPKAITVDELMNLRSVNHVRLSPDASVQDSMGEV
jgi:hypothetical protein